MSNLANHLTTATAEANRAYDADTSSIFGTTGLRGDPHQLTFLQRDADERVARAQTPAELQQLLATAVSRNDQILSRAVAQAAVTKGDAATASAFQQHYPDQADTLERVWNVNQARANPIHPWKDTLNMRISKLKPDQLAGRMNYEIDGIAATTQDA
jgi:hypothetical protein